MSFADLGLSPYILRALDDTGYTTPTPIQAGAIPIVLSGQDLLGCAQTGTGKTAAFSLPIIHILSSTQPVIGQKKRPIRTLIVTPTRELAIQIHENVRAYSAYTTLRSCVIYGGVGQHAQVNALNAGIDILIATPGRLLDLINQGHISLAHIQIFVLDEADRMLDMGFVHDVKKLLKIIPTQRQSLFFSATMPPDIVSLARTILRDPERITVTPVSSTVEIISQSIYYVDRENKPKLLVELLQSKDIRTALVFTRTKHGANKVVKMLTENRISAEAIHGNKSQNARQKALEGFKSQTIRVLVATDIAARGIDIDALAHVVNYEIPNISETYVHRIGRTGRAGASGTAISFVDATEKVFLRDIEKLIQKKIPVVDDHAYPLRDHDAVEEPKYVPQKGTRNGAGRWSGKSGQSPQKPSTERGVRTGGKVSTEGTSRNSPQGKGSTGPRTPYPDSRGARTANSNKPNPDTSGRDYRAERLAREAR